MKRHLLLLISTALLLFSCSEKQDPAPEPIPTPKPETERIPIKISTAITKATDTEFEQGDQVGIYIVNDPSQLQSSGNHADNVRFKYAGTWASDSQLYWKDETTKADFYCYYPYQSGISDVGAYHFSVKRDQTSESNYKSNDFMWGKTENVSPTNQAVGIIVKRIMSNVIIKLVAGNGYTDEDMANAKVTICGLQTSCNINLSNGEVTANGSVADILPRDEKSARRAFIIPQSVTEIDLIKVEIGDKSYVLNQSAVFESGKQHTCTITVEKKNQGINIGIGDWVVDENDFGGIVE